jgi:hypothetical protein
LVALVINTLMMDEKIKKDPAKFRVRMDPINFKLRLKLLCTSRIGNGEPAARSQLHTTTCDPWLMSSGSV